MNPVPLNPTPSPSWLNGWITPSNVASVATALIALIALTVAIFALVANRRSARNSQRSADTAQAQLDRLEEERSKEQASRLAVWATAIEAVRRRDSDGHPTQESFGYAWEMEVAVHNASVQPIYQVHVFVHDPGPDPTFPTPGQRYRVGRLRVVPPMPHGPVKFRVPFGAEFPRVAYLPEIGLTFLDAGDRRWIRTPRGSLKRSSEGEVDAVIKDMDEGTRALYERAQEAGDDVPPWCKLNPIDKENAPLGW